MVRLILIVMLVLVAASACDDGGGPSNGGEPPEEAFALGVASGDVTSDSAVLWTRAEGADALAVEVSTSENFDSDVIESEVETSDERDYTAKLKVDGLEPDTRYYYRFRLDGEMSATGTFITAPKDDVSKSLRFVFSGDADGSRLDDGTAPYGEFEVLDAAAAEDAAFFLFFGDTIYADREPNQAGDLDGFRFKYRENRGYDALRNILASTSTYNMWDDHEVYNNFVGEFVDDDLFAGALQAFREYMPIDDDGDPEVLYRDFRWGADVDMILLDERSFRDGTAEEVCTAGDQPDPLPAGAADDAPGALRGIREFVGLPDELPGECTETIEDESRSMLGDEQKEYFLDWLSNSDATWKIVANPVPMMSLLVSPYDRWEGYAAERREILEFIRDEGIKNVVFLTTDFHSNIFSPVRMDPFEDTEPIGYEAIAGPIATTTFSGDVEEFVGEAGVGGVDAFLAGIVQVDCAELDSYAYGLVEVDEESMVITAKDAEGTQLCRVELEAE